MTSSAAGALIVIVADGVLVTGPGAVVGASAVGTVSITAIVVAPVAVCLVSLT